MSFYIESVPVYRKVHFLMTTFTGDSHVSTAFDYYFLRGIITASNASYRHWYHLKRFDISIWRWFDDICKTKHREFNKAQIIFSYIYTHFDPYCCISWSGLLSSLACVL